MQGLRLLHSSFKKNIKEGPQFAAKIVYVLFDPKYVPLLSLLPPFSNFIRIEPSTYKIFFIFIIIGIFILLSREKATKRCMSSLRSCQPSVYHTKMGESRQVPFPTAQVNLPAFFTLSLKC